MTTPGQLRPELAGVKVKKRKKDLKSKYEPEEFAEELIDELKEAEGNLELISKKIDTIADSLDFKKYVEPLFDVLFTGGILDVGGGHVEGIELSPFSIFAAEDSPVAIKKCVEVFNLLIRRYRYLQKGFEDAITKMLRLLVRFSPSECKKLATACTFFFVTQMAPMSLLNVLFMDHLVKEGHSLQFITVLFKEFIAEQSVEHLTSSLKKNFLDDRLMEFFPASKRTEEFFTRHFVAEGLKEIVTLHERKNQSKLKNDFKETLQRMISEKSAIPEVVAYLKQNKQAFPDSELIGLVWESIVGSIEWSRRPEQCEEQLLKIVKEWGKLLAVVVTNAKTELNLLVILQGFCYDDSRFTKTFSKLVTLFYKMEVVSETAIVYWHTKGASAKGKSVFLQQMEPFIKWLNEAEEESGGEN